MFCRMARFIVRRTGGIRLTRRRRRSGRRCWTKFRRCRGLTRRRGETGNLPAGRPEIPKRFEEGVVLAAVALFEGIERQVVEQVADLVQEGDKRGIGVNGNVDGDGNGGPRTKNVAAALAPTLGEEQRNCGETWESVQ